MHHPMTRWLVPLLSSDPMWARDRRPAWGCPQDVLLSGAAAGLLRAQPPLRRGDGLCVASPQEAVLVGPPSALAVPSRLLSFGKDVAAGTVAGMAVVCVGHPFDTLKVLLQTQPCDKPLYTGVVDAFKVRTWGRGNHTQLEVHVAALHWTQHTAARPASGLLSPEVVPLHVH